MFRKFNEFVNDRPWIYLLFAGYFLAAAIDAYRAYDLAKQAVETAEYFKDAS